MDLTIIIIISLFGIGAGIALFRQINHCRILFQQNNAQIHSTSLPNLNDTNV